MFAVIDKAQYFEVISQNDGTVWCRVPKRQNNSDRVSDAQRAVIISDALKKYSTDVDEKEDG